MKIIPKCFFSKEWLIKLFKNNFSDPQKSFDNFCQIHKDSLRNNLSFDHNSQMRSLIINLVLNIHQSNFDDPKKKEYIEYFLFNFLRDYFRESEITKAIHEVTILLEKYEISSK